MTGSSRRGWLRGDWRVLLRMDPWLVLVATGIALTGLLLVGSTTQGEGGDPTMFGRQAVFVCGSALAGLVLVLIPYARVQRMAWPLYVVALVALLLLPYFGILINGARRWYRLPGFSLQPSEFAKLAVILVLASWLRFRRSAGFWQGLGLPLMFAGVPALLIMRQPDLGSSLVLWPVVLAMCFAAGAPARRLLAVVGCGVVVTSIGYFALHDYQKRRIDVWAAHFQWDRQVEEAATPAGAQMRQLLKGPAYQPWQSLIAIGSGGTTGFGLGKGPQSQYDFLPYRESDYVFAVLAEETGFVGASIYLVMLCLLVFLLLGVAWRSRERFGRLLCVGVATWLGSQSLMHIAVCAWMVPATGLPLPLCSYGGSSTLAAVLGVALVLNVSARREPVLSRDGWG